MIQRISSISLIAVLAATLVACATTKKKNPLRHLRQRLPPPRRHLHRKRNLSRPCQPITRCNVVITFGASPASPAFTAIPMPGL